MKQPISSATQPTTSETTIQSSVQAFHEHTDQCAQCAYNPKNLCEIGRALLLTTGEFGRTLRGVGA